MQEILTVNELFSGIGAQRKALERLGIAHEVVGVCEIDKYAIQSYEAIFGETYNYGDICTAPRLDYADLWTYSFPCQDISVAGRGKGINENTRSGLLYQVQRLLEVAKDEGKLPKYLLLENVKNLVGKKFKSQFDDWLFYLDQLGYDTYWQVLNAKHYGIPQNRERVFAISIRKDLNQTFEFPKAEELKIRLKDVLEDEVDEKYYLSQDKVNKFYKTLDQRLVNSSQLEVQPCIVSKQGTCFEKETDIACTLMARDYKGFGNQGMNGVIEFPCIGASRGRNPENPSDRTVGAPTEQRLEINTQGTTNTITTVQKDNYIVEMYQQPRGKNNGGFKEVAPTITSSKYEHNNLVVSMYNPYNKAKLDDVAPAQTTGNRNTTSSSVLVVEAKIQQIKGNLYPNSGNPQAGRVYEPEGISPALDTCQGGNRMPKILENQIQKVDIPQIVKVRKYEVDNAKLVELLRSHKNLTNKQIADALNVPLTKVEHWFRTDNCFAIPDAEIWYQLKELLNIQTDEFDVAITTFEEKEGIYEKNNRCYLTTGIAPTLTTSSCVERNIIDDTQGFDGVRTYENYSPTLRACRSGLKTTDGIRIRKLTPLECWRLMGFDDEDFQKAQQSGVSNTQLYKQAGNSIVVNVLEKIFENLCK